MDALHVLQAKMNPSLPLQTTTLSQVTVSAFYQLNGSPTPGCLRGPDMINTRRLSRRFGDGAMDINQRNSSRSPRGGKAMVSFHDSTPAAKHVALF